MIVGNVVFVDDSPGYNTGILESCIKELFCFRGRESYRVIKDNGFIAVEPRAQTPYLVRGERRDKIHIGALDNTHE